MISREATTQYGTSQMDWPDEGSVADLSPLNKVYQPLKHRKTRISIVSVGFSPVFLTMVNLDLCSSI